MWTWGQLWGLLLGRATPELHSSAGREMGRAHLAALRSLPQESISDFYWYYSGKDVIDEQGKRNFSKAMAVAKQVFNSLTEYIQVGSLRHERSQGLLRGSHNLPRALRTAAAGACHTPSVRGGCAGSQPSSSLPPPPSQGPCTGNQQSLAHSRLWDAVIGFLHVFAHMMMKLAQVKRTRLRPDPRKGPRGGGLFLGVSCECGPPKRLPGGPGSSRDSVRGPKANPHTPCQKKTKEPTSSSQHPESKS